MTAEKPPIFELPIDAYIALDQITMELVESIDHLAPFGSGNPPIILASRGLVIKSHTTIGKTKEHLQVIVEDVSTATQKVLWWQGAGSPLPEGSFDLAYSVRAANFRGQHSLQLEWIAFRQFNSTIEIRPSSKFEIIDFRQCLDPLSRLPEFANKPLTLIWGEGEINAPVSIIDRYHLFQAQSLVLWTIPPGRDELREILQVVRPKQVVIFGINSAPDKPQVFLNRLIGLIRFIIRAYQGKTSLKVLAAATSQRETTIKKGLAWLVASGFIKIEAIDENIILVQSDKHTPNILSVKQIESEISHLLTETGAYRAYFSRADTENLLED